MKCECNSDRTTIFHPVDAGFDELTSSARISIKQRGDRWHGVGSGEVVPVPSGVWEGQKFLEFFLHRSYEC